MHQQVSASTVQEAAQQNGSYHQTSSNLNGIPDFTEFCSSLATSVHQVKMEPADTCDLIDSRGLQQQHHRHPSECSSSPSTQQSMDHSHQHQQTQLIHYHGMVTGSTPQMQSLVSPAYYTQASQEMHYTTSLQGGNNIQALSSSSHLQNMQSPTTTTNIPINYTQLTYNMESDSSTRPYKPCVVCSDRSSGYHYGVSSCEGCKGFFRRSVQKNLSYQCNKEKACIINKVTRNRCQFCRLQRCFTMGMSKEAVRNDRHKKKRAETDNAVSSSPVIAEPLEPEDEKLINLVVSAHEESFPTPAETELVTEVKEEQTVDIWEKIEELSTTGVKRIVSFAKCIPDFERLPRQVQITLLKASSLEIVILRLASRYDAGTNSIVFSTGIQLTVDALKSLGFSDILEPLVRLASRLQDLKVDPKELALISAVCLACGDRMEITDSAPIDHIQEKLLTALRRHIRNTYPTQPRRFAKLLYKITDLRAISIKGANRVLKFRQEKTGGEVPPLVVELLNREENVCMP